MGNFLDEEVPPVNPLSMEAIEELGRCFLEQFSPETLKAPQPLDVLGLIDNKLPKFGINVYPASREEIGNRDGATDVKGDGETVILIEESRWEQLELPAPRSFFARTTVCHEIGHAILHVPVLRRRLMVTEVLSRTSRGSLRAYEDPEWQAWAFAGAILMPTSTLRMLQGQRASLAHNEVSRSYEVSVQMVAAHLKRLKWPAGNHA